MTELFSKVLNNDYSVTVRRLFILLVFFHFHFCFFTFYFLPDQALQRPERIVNRLENHCQCKIQRQYRDKAGHKCLRARLTYTLRTFFACKALITADCRNCRSEDKSFYNPDNHVPRL